LILAHHENKGERNYGILDKSHCTDVGCGGEESAGDGDLCKQDSPLPLKNPVPIEFRL
jgi:hypothetical protein